MAVYITYQQVRPPTLKCMEFMIYTIDLLQGKLTRLVEAGMQTLSSINVNPSSYSLVTIGQTIKRLTMEKLADQSGETGGLIKEI